MIIVKKDEFTVACNGCGSRNDVMRVSAGINGSYGGFLLCRKCRSELMKKLSYSLNDRQDAIDRELEHFNWQNECQNG